MLNFVMTEFSEVRLVRVLEMKFDYIRKTGINAHQLALKADGRAPFARLQVYAAWCPRVFCNVGLQACLAMDIEPQEFCTALEYYEPAPLGMLPSTSTEDIQGATT